MLVGTSRQREVPTLKAEILYISSLLFFSLYLYIFSSFVCVCMLCVCMSVYFILVFIFMEEGSYLFFFNGHGLSLSLCSVRLFLLLFTWMFFIIIWIYNNNLLGLKEELFYNVLINEVDNVMYPWATFLLNVFRTRHNKKNLKKRFFFKQINKW